MRDEPSTLGRVRDMVPAGTRTALTKTDRADLDLRHRRSLAHITLKLGVSRQTISHLASRVRIELRPPYRPKVAVAPDNQLDKL